MFTTRTTALILCAAALLCAGPVALAADAAKADAPKADVHRMEVSKETREKMASVHEQMAACLRSTKSLDDCHHEMMKAHEAMHDEMKGDMKGEHDCDKMMERHHHMEHGHDSDATK